MESERDTMNEFSSKEFRRRCKNNSSFAVSYLSVIKPQKCPPTLPRDKQSVVQFIMTKLVS